MTKPGEPRYCGPCGEYYAEGDNPLDSKACPFCDEIGSLVADLGEQQDEDNLADFHDGGSSRAWKDN